MDSFYDKIREQLNQMTEQEKDAWILSQAKILPEWKQEDFYKSICGTKKVINMPERSEIFKFCKKVRKSIPRKALFISGKLAKIDRIQF